MKYNILTLIVTLILILCTQVIALFVQYRVNRVYKGIGYWLLGSSLMALGFILMPMLSIIANPLLILGHIFFYIGIKRFFNRELNKWIPISSFIIFNLFYYYNIFVKDSITVRTVVISTAIGVISFMIAYELFSKKDGILAETVNFTAGVFLVYGWLNIIRGFYTLATPPVHSYIEQGNSIIAVLIISIIFSNLWTLGLIITVNQSLNIENKAKKEKLQLMFNTSIDAQLITQLEDGLIVDANDEFTILSGYTKEEVIGSYTKDSILWANPKDRELFKAEISYHQDCRNMEFNFKRKDGSRFTGIISGRILEINDSIQIISVIRDITKRKEVESQMITLVEQLEIEKNTAQRNAITDSLSGLFNRGYFDNILRAEFFRLMRSGGPLSLIMLDIDHFKNFNDTYGHLAGDECIQMISRTLKDIGGRASDIAARYGGEEFILILPETNSQGAKMMGERIRRAIEELAIPHEASETAKNVTVSVGIVTMYPSELASAEQILKLVDEALYEAKETGRNRCVYKDKIIKILGDE